MKRSYVLAVTLLALSCDRSDATDHARSFMQDMFPDASVQVSCVTGDSCADGNDLPPCTAIVRSADRAPSVYTVVCASGNTRRRGCVLRAVVNR